MLLKFQPDWMKIVDFLLIAKFWASLLFFDSPSMQIFSYRLGDLPYSFHRLFSDYCPLWRRNHGKSQLQILYLNGTLTYVSHLLHKKLEVPIALLCDRQCSKLNLRKNIHKSLLIDRLFFRLNSLDWVLFSTISFVTLYLTRQQCLGWQNPSACLYSLARPFLPLRAFLLCYPLKIK